MALFNTNGGLRATGGFFLAVVEGFSLWLQRKNLQSYKVNLADERTKCFWTMGLRESDNASIYCSSKYI